MDGPDGLVGGILWLLLGLLEAVRKGESYILAHNIARVATTLLDEGGPAPRWEAKSHCGCTIAWVYDLEARRWNAEGVVDAAPDCEAQFVS